MHKCADVRDQCGDPQRAKHAHAQRRPRPSQALWLINLALVVYELLHWSALKAKLLKIHPAAWLTTVAALTYAIIFGRLAVTHHNNFGTWAWDLGIYDQAFWLVSRGGQTFMTVRGLDVWGHHINVIAYLFAPIYWLGGGATFLCAFQSLVLGLGALPVYLLARDRLKNSWMGLLFALAYLMYAPLQWLSWRDFHPEVLAITPLLAAWWCARTCRWVWFYAFICIVLLTREDTALAVIALGVVLAFSKASATRRAGLGTAAAAFVWYLIATRFILPHFNRGQQAYYIKAFYSNYGTTTIGILGHIVTHPQQLYGDAVQADRLRFYRDLILPFGGLPILAPLQLLVALPQLLANAIGLNPYARMIKFQYTALLIAPITVAAINGAARVWHFYPYKSFKTKSLRAILVLWLVVASIATNVAWSNSAIGHNPDVWNGESADRTLTMQHAVSLIPDNVPVTATYTLLPHLTHRENIYDWPVPWIDSYWGIDDGYRLPAPETVQWIAIDRHHVGETEKRLFADLIAPGGAFIVDFDKDDIVVAHRRTN